jgi:hypothetical protein
VSKKILVERVLCEMPGGAHSRLVLCDNGVQYVVKSPDNPQGPNVLANELIAASLMSAIGLPVAPWRRVNYSFPDKCFSDHPTSGLHFASELLRAPMNERLYSFLPSSFIPRIENRPMFLGALVFDIWAGSTDVRQVIYVENKNTGTFKVVFIDNGHLFGGPHWEFSLNSGAAICLETEVYSNLLDPKTIEAWIVQIETKVVELLPDLIKTVPAEWYKGDIVCLREILLLRARSLRSLFWNEIATIKEPLRSSFRGTYEPSTHPPVLPGGIQ